MVVHFFDHESLRPRADAPDSNGQSLGPQMPSLVPAAAAREVWNSAASSAASSLADVEADLIDRALPVDTTEITNWALLLGNSVANVQDRAIRDLRRPAAVAQQLVDHWDDWGLPDGLNQQNLLSPSLTLPIEAREMLRYVAQNPALFSAMDSGGCRGVMNDGDIWKFDAADFAAKARDDLRQASLSYIDFLSSNASADFAARTWARDVVLLMANQGILAAAGPTQFGAPSQLAVRGTFSIESLISVSRNPGLGTALVAAAGRMAGSSLLEQLGSATDGAIDADMLDRWLTSRR